MNKLREVAFVVYSAIKGKRLSECFQASDIDAIEEALAPFIDDHIVDPNKKVTDHIPDVGQKVGIEECAEELRKVVGEFHRKDKYTVSTNKYLRILSRYWPKEQGCDMESLIDALVLCQLDGNKSRSIDAMRASILSRLTDTAPLKTRIKELEKFIFEMGVRAGEQAKANQKGGE